MDYLSDAGSVAYFKRIGEYPILSEDLEYILAKAAESGDAQASERLVTSHLRYVAKIAVGYRGYGLPMGEVISEGNIGLIKAVNGFDPDKGHRLSTYSLWWIKAAIQEYVLRNWSVVRVGTTSAQKKLFFNLRKLKSKLRAYDDGDLTPDQVSAIAENLNVPEADVLMMDRRLTKDSSLNIKLGEDGEGDEWQDWIADESPDSEEILVDREQKTLRNSALKNAISILEGKEREVFEARHLREIPETLGVLSDRFGLCRERVRQIELTAYAKVKKHILGAATN